MTKDYGVYSGLSSNMTGSVKFIMRSDSVEASKTTNEIDTENNSKSSKTDKSLIEKIKEGIQEKKGKNIIIADLTNIEDTICKYFVICQGNSPSQVGAIVDSIKEFTRKGADSKPFAVDGLRNAEWVAMDYADVLVHVFLPETRAFYNLEHLWADAKLIQIPDLD